MYANTTKERRFQRTLSFLQNVVSTDSKILDLGIKNPLSELMCSKGYQVINTKDENLDDDFELYANKDVDVVTAFEIFEHMMAPYNILKAIKASQLVASIPLKLWFSSAYWNEQDDWDKHYHEFEKKQFDLLLNRTGWIIKKSDIWASADYKKFGVRPILRYFYPRYYIVFCERE